MLAPQQLERLPRSTGVYLMRDARGKVLYVGKAVNLRARVRSYFSGQDTRVQVPTLVSRVADVDFVATRSERDALILESRLISEHRPPFNIDLRDDKTWLSIRLDTEHPFPRLEAVRRWRRDGARYFGPFLMGSHARRIVAALRAALPLRNCTNATLTRHKRLGRPCLEAQMGRCSAPCVGEISSEGYGALVEKTVAVLEGRAGPARELLERRMWRASEAEDYERAARYRDLAELVSRAFVRTQVRGRPGQTLDVWGLYREGDSGFLVILPVRNGEVLEGRAVPLEAVMAKTPELLASLLHQRYGASDHPPEVLLPELPEGAKELAALLGVKLRVPHRGDGRRFLDLALHNARQRHQVLTNRQAEHSRAMKRLATLLGLDRVPRVIECIDNSHSQGEHAYSSLVRQVDGKAEKSGYRLFRLPPLQGDDYEAMRLSLGKRLERGLAGMARWDLPDLIVVDGGRGQLSAALKAAKDAKLPPGTLAWCAIAKPQGGQATDRIFIPNRVNPLPLGAYDPALRLLQQVRDEAHRFGIRQHRKSRRKSLRLSILDEVRGLGPMRKQALLKTFGSVKEIRRADSTALQQVEGIGPGLAQLVAESLADYSAS